MVNYFVDQTLLFYKMKMIKENKLEILLTILYVFLLGFLFFSVFSCNQKSANTEKILPTEKAKQRVVPEKIQEEKTPIKTIHTYEVVMVIPSQKQLDSIQNTMEDDEYSTFVDESSYYINQAKEYCEAIHSSVVEVETGESLVFLSEKGTKFPFSTKGLLWEMIVFNGITKPEKIDVTSPQDEMIRVYNKIKK